MAYGLIYFTQFSDVENNNSYTLSIYEKNYTGGASRVNCSGTPAIHTWTKDEEFKGIRGSQLAVNLINEGNLPLTRFYSEEDDTFQVQLIQGSKILFIGYLVQDDCNEDLVDYSHNISLSFTDNLALLKDVTISELFGTTRPGVQSIFTFLKFCLRKTGVELDLYLYFNLTEASFTLLDNALSQTFIDFNGFANSSNSSTYKDCYTVLDEVLKRFNACLFQSNSAWNIVRWAELRYFPLGRIRFERYDKTSFNFLNDGFLDNIFNVGFNTPQPFEIGAYTKITRPKLYVLDTFNYVQPPNVWNNSDLKQLGNLRTSYTTGSGVNLQTIEEYDLVGFGQGFIWQDNAGTIILYNTATPKFIRLIKDYLGREVDRYMVVSGSGAPDDRTVISSDKILLNKGDSIKISFEARRNATSLGAATKPYFAWLVTKDPINPRGANNKALDTNGNWIAQPTPIGANNSIVTTYTSGEDLADWKTIEVDSKVVPFDGYLYIQFGTLNIGGNYNEWHYKNFKAEITYSVDKVGKVTGHTHQQKFNTLAIKNTEKKDLIVDDSLSNNISGTLLKNSLINGLFNARTSEWRRLGTSTSERLRLGQITVFEDLYLFRKSRTYIEATIVNNSNGLNFISPLSVLKTPTFVGIDFVIGRLEVDYRNSISKASMFELYESGETDAILNGISTYNFNYIIDGK